MSKLTRDNWLALGLFFLLGVMTTVALWQQAVGAPLPPLTSHSTQPDGAAALWQWLEALDYTVFDEVTHQFSIPNEVTVVLILNPTFLIEDHHWVEIDEWVEAGGTLIIAGDDRVAWTAWQHYEFGVDTVSTDGILPRWETPFFRSPTMPVPGPWLGRSYLVPQRTDFVTHLTINPGLVEDYPVLVSFTQESGRVILSTSAELFSNEGLKQAGNGLLVLNMLAVSEREGRVWFNEWHHGAWQALNEVDGMGAWLRGTPLGRSFLYMGIMVFLFLLLRGQIFGRPVPLTQDIVRRAPVEYITAIANMSRRAGHRTAVLQDHHDRLKRELSRRYRLDPTLPNDEFIKLLKVYDPNVDEVALSHLLAQLSRKNVTEAEMVQLSVEVSEWL